MTRLVFALILILIMSATYYGGKTALSQAGIGPNNPLYFFDNLMEKLDIWGTDDKEKKVEKLINFLNEKYAEASSMLQGGDNISANLALLASDKYVNDAIDFINNLKVEGKKTDNLVENLGEAVLGKQEILAGVYKDAPSAAKAYIEEVIKKEKSEVVKIVKNLDENTSQKLTAQIEQVGELVSDKIAEVKELEEKEALEDLTKQEQLYNIWIEHFYSTNEGDMILVNAHIRRRDPKCSEFHGKMNVYINNNFYRSFNVAAKGYDDVRGTFDRFFLEKGSYQIKGELVDDKNRIISRREFKLVI